MRVDASNERSQNCYRSLHSNKL